jgi:hypothetical protein
MDAFGLSFYIMKAGFTSSEKKWRIISAARSSDGRSKGDIDLQCFGPTGGYASRDPSTGEGTRQHVDPLPSPSCAYLEGSLLSRFFAFPTSSPLHRCTPPSSASGSSLTSAALSLYLSLVGAPPSSSSLCQAVARRPLSAMAQIYGHGPNCLFFSATQPTEKW